MQNKYCIKCKIKKSISEFRSLRNSCKECERKYSNNWNNTHKKQQHEWYLVNKERLNKRRKEYYLETREHTLEVNREWERTHKAERKKYLKSWKKKYNSILEHRIVDRLRNRINCALKGRRKADHTKELIGCSVEFLKIWLELQFQPGMSWENYGFYGWHVDHIIPCCQFNLTDPVQQKICFHYTNLQPLWAYDNISKGNRERTHKCSKIKL